MLRFLWMPIALTLLGPISAQALEVGDYFSKNNSTGRLVVRAWGQGYSVDSCANYGEVGCLQFRAVVVPSGTDWQGTGTLTITYRNTQQQFDCAYSMETKISVSPDGKTYLALYLPQTMYKQVYRCPTRREVGENQWHYLEHPYAKR